MRRAARDSGAGPRSHHGARLSPRESLLFEAGIKLGGVFHQYLGTPVSPDTARDLGRTIAAAVRLQPYVREVRVRVDTGAGGPVGSGAFRYHYLTAEMLHVRVTLEDGGERLVAELVHRADLRYPLMRVVAVGPTPRTRDRTRPRSARRPGRT